MLRSGPQSGTIEEVIFFNFDTFSFVVCTFFTKFFFYEYIYMSKDISYFIISCKVKVSIFL